MILFIQRDCPDTGLAVGLQGDEGNALDGTVLGDHHQVFVFIKFSRDHHGGNSLAGLQRQHIDHGRAAGSTACLGNLVTLPVVDLADVGEEQDMVVGGCNIQALDIVLVL